LTVRTLLLLLAVTTLVRATARVVVAAPEDQEAAHELTHYIAKATGDQLPIVVKTADGEQQILVGVGACPPEVQERVRRLRGDGYLIETLGDGTLVLAGNGHDGTWFAVDRFLELSLGIRWLWPGESGEVLPSGSLRFDGIRVEAEPAYLWRDLGPGGALWGPLDKHAKERQLGVSPEHQRLEQLWQKRNGFGGLRFYGGHAFGEILLPAKYGHTHPEYFALVKGRRVWENFDGKHGAQPCTSNPQVVRITADYVNQFFDQHPEYDAFSISLNDGGGFCECDRCRRLDAGKQQMMGGDVETGSAGLHAVITDRIITFANEVAQRMARFHNNKKLILFAYGPYKRPPERVKPDPHLIIQYTFHAAQDWDPKAEKLQIEATGAWSRAASELGIYEYFIQGNWPDLPRLIPQPMARSVLQLHELGYRYYQTQAGDGYALNGLNYYLLGRLLWNPLLDEHAIEQDYIEKGFGRAAPAVGRYFRLIESRWRELAGRPLGMDLATREEYFAIAAAFPPAFREAARRDLEEAYNLAQGADRERVAFLQRGWHYVELTVDAVDKTLPLFQEGWSFAPAIHAPANADLDAFRSALAAWKERERYVETLKQDFVIAYFWERYNAEQRSFVPLKRMEEYTAARLPDGGRVFTQQRVQQWRSRIRQTLFMPDPLPPLAIETHGSFEPEPGVIAERITYATEFGLCACRRFSAGQS
jgi:hypothetical protein